MRHGHRVVVGCRPEHLMQPGAEGSWLGHSAVDGRTLSAPVPTTLRVIPK